CRHPMSLTDELLALARTVGREASAYVAGARPTGRVDVASTKSSPTDVVTAIDEACERLIRSLVLGSRPDDSFQGEEGDDIAGTSGVEWIVDPIDGTVNFVYGIPAYAISIAAAVDGRVEVGCVINIASGEEFTAVRDQGSFLHTAAGTARLVAPEVERLDQALVSTGFSYVPSTRAVQARAVAKMLPQVRDVRRVGSAALDLCGLAAGRADAYVEQGLKPWDLAAGGLIASEAGIVVSGLDGIPGERLVMAAHPSVSGEFFALVRACGF
ncbi:MAG: inositol monophosphatase family protein, partial [Aeromicrobium sp.]